MREPVLLPLLLVLLGVLQGAGRRCGELEVQARAGRGGFSSACFERKAVTFDTCKRLLWQRQGGGCSALTYSDVSCSLHDRSLPSWVPAQPASLSMKRDYSGGNVSVLQMFLLISEVDACSPTTNVQSDTLFDTDLPVCFQNSLLAPLPSLLQSEIHSRVNDQVRKLEGLHRWLNLPRLGIIMTVTSDWLSKHRIEMESIVDNWTCYAKIYNYNFHLHVMEPVSTIEKLYHDRHGSVVDAFLHKYRFLLVLDSDNLVVNMSRSLDHIVNASPLNENHPYANTDIFFHMREGGEITASTYFVRNSVFTKCFIQYWRNMAPSEVELNISNNIWIQTPNNDNGDLVAALMNVIHPHIALKCSSKLRSHDENTNRHRIYDNKILLCFRMFRGALANITNLVPQIKVFFIREDFFRMHSGHTITKENMLLRKDVYCHQNDIIVHGWKELGSQYWPRVITSRVGGDRDKAIFPSCDIKTFKAGGGGNKFCRWLSHDHEMDIVKLHCYWRSPQCWAANKSASKLVENNSAGMVNICVNDEMKGGHCWDKERLNLLRWQLCSVHQLCDPYMSLAQIRSKYLSRYELRNPW